MVKAKDSPGALQVPATHLCGWTSYPAQRGEAEKHRPFAPRIIVIGHVETGGNDIAWRPGSHYDVAATRGVDSVLASDCRAQFGRPSTRRECCMCVTVRLPVRQRGETMYWQANANTPLSVTPLFLNVPDLTWANKSKTSFTPRTKEHPWKLFSKPILKV